MNPEPYKNCWFCHGNLENCPYHNPEFPDGRPAQEDTTSMEEKKDKLRYEILTSKGIEEPQTERWRAEARKTISAALADKGYGIIYEAAGETILDAVSSLLSKTRLEERQRVVRIAEGMRRAIPKDPMDVTPREAMSAAILPIYRPYKSEEENYNQGLSDLSSRVLEEEK